MRTRLPLICVLLLALDATPALAMDLQGKWGLGVGAGGVVGTSTDVTIFRGRSPSSGWLIDLMISGSNANLQQNFSPADTVAQQATHQNSNQLSVHVGPGIRHFLVATGPFSPYLDVGLVFEYSCSHDYADSPGGFQRVETSDLGFGVAAALGAEYLTPWHFSLAAHSGLASVQWARTSNTTEFPYNPPVEHTTSGVTAVASIHPVLELRVYF